MTNNLRDQLIGVGFGDSLPEGKILNYALGRSGLFMTRRSEIGEVTIELAKVSDGIKGAPEMKPSFISPIPRIPFSVFSPAIAFLKAVKEELKTEGLVRFIYTPPGDGAEEGKWTAFVPRQTVGPAEVEVKEGVMMPPGIFAAEIHSHPGSSASPSSVDDANEQVDRMFMIVAFPANSAPVFTARIGMSGVKRWLPSTLADMVNVEETISWKKVAANLFFGGRDTFPYFAYPEEWLDQVEERKAVIVTHGAWPRKADEVGKQLELPVPNYTGWWAGRRWVNGKVSEEFGRLGKKERKALKKIERNEQRELEKWLADRAKDGTILAQDVVLD